VINFIRQGRLTRPQPEEEMTADVPCSPPITGQRAAAGIRARCTSFLLALILLHVDISPKQFVLGSSLSSIKQILAVMEINPRN